MTIGDFRRSGFVSLDWQRSRIPPSQKVAALFEGLSNARTSTATAIVQCRTKGINHLGNRVQDRPLDDERKK
ncbi:hypothetical protein OUZ56_029332 [Daphnia magna]|uniref:Uncharacterized protein n=1 Tax=Daphnia magna TaxID=35525 RepID=A0ABR0B6J0_9CRUS|nr:hypothetical protein OUZ56_029332 [Daphnia magna]